MKKMMKKFNFLFKILCCYGIMSTTLSFTANFLNHSVIQFVTLNSYSQSTSINVTDTLKKCVHDCIIHHGHRYCESGVYYDTVSLTRSVDTIYKIVVENYESNIVYTEPEDKIITVPYGTCDTTLYLYYVPILINHGETEIVNIDLEADLFYETGRTYTLEWKWEDNCGIENSCTQQLIIKHAPCGDEDNFYIHDNEGNIYSTVQIGCDCWMKENLKSTRYANGDSIIGIYEYIADQYPDKETNINRFGRLYDWYSAVHVPEESMTVIQDTGFIQGACPNGWYLPDNEMIQTLGNYLSTDLKTDELWIHEPGTNHSGFTALPAGFYQKSNNRYYNLMGNTYFWTSNSLNQQEALHYQLNYYCEVMIEKEFLKENGGSIRCIKR